MSEDGYDESRSPERDVARGQDYELSADVRKGHFQIAVKRGVKEEPQRGLSAQEICVGEPTELSSMNKELCK